RIQAVALAPLQLLNPAGGGRVLAVALGVERLVLVVDDRAVLLGAEGVDNALCSGSVHAPERDVLRAPITGAERAGGDDLNPGRLVAGDEFSRQNDQQPGEGRAVVCGDG